MQEEKTEKAEKESRTKEGARKYAKLNVWEETYKGLMDYLTQLNAQSKRTFNINEILGHALAKLDQSDFISLQERYYTATDRFQLLLDKLNSSGQTITEEALLAKLVEGFEGEKRSKATRPPKDQKDLALT
jgi:hypothetical protein